MKKKALKELLAKRLQDKLSKVKAKVRVKKAGK